MYAAGFYSYSILALVFWETKCSDFVVSMGHHVITVILIVLSYIFRFVRVGSVVLALHDASDVFIETGKMSKYSGAETTASIAFILFVSCFTVTRIIYYPFWILRSTSYEVVHALKMDLVDGCLLNKSKKKEKLVKIYDLIQKMNMNINMKNEQKNVQD
ncbi:LAG1 longevity assurance 3 [Glycine soja]